MAGLDELNRNLHPKCPHCKTALDLREYWNVLFEAILAKLSSGERVRIAGFGSFAAKPFGGWKIKGLDGQTKEVSKRKVIRFYAAELAKSIVNSTT